MMRRAGDGGGSQVKSVPQVGAVIRSIPSLGRGRGDRLGGT